MSIALREGFVNVPLENVLEDLITRFVINCPNEDLASIERVFFQIEEAHWFYLDFIRNINPSLPSMSMKTFSKQMIDTCPVIWKWGNSGEALARFGKYKSTIPVRGVALFNDSLKKVLLIQGTESDSWSFPRGKINKDEEDWECAVRECREETGFDATDHINENDVVERTIRGKNYKIYLIRNVPEDFDFKPEVRNEIKNIEWRSWKKLYKKLDRRFSENLDKKNKGKRPRFFLIESMYQPINNWVQKQAGVLDEEQMKEYAESQLKILLGIGESKKHGDDAKLQIDRGRELLDLLHKNEHGDNATKKDIPDLFQQLFGYKQPQQQQSDFNGIQPSVPSKTNHLQQQPRDIQSQMIPSYTNFVPPFPFPIYNQKQIIGHPLPQFYQPAPLQMPGFLSHISPLPDNVLHTNTLSKPSTENANTLVSTNNQDNTSKKESDDDEADQKQYYYQLQSHEGSIPDPEKFSKPSFDFTQIAKKKNQDDSSKKELLSILTRPKKDKIIQDIPSESGFNSSVEPSYDNMLLSTREQLLSSNSENPLLALLKQRKSFSKPESNDDSTSRTVSANAGIQLADFFKKKHCGKPIVEHDDSTLAYNNEKSYSSILPNTNDNYSPPEKGTGFEPSGSFSPFGNDQFSMKSLTNHNGRNELLSILKGGSKFDDSKNSDESPVSVIPSNGNLSNNELLNILRSGYNTSLSSQAPADFSAPLFHSNSSHFLTSKIQQQQKQQRNDAGESEKASNTLLNMLHQNIENNNNNFSFPTKDGSRSPSMNDANTILKILKRPKSQQVSTPLSADVSNVKMDVANNSSKHSSGSNKSKNSSRSGSNKKGHLNPQPLEPNMHDMNFQVLKRPKDGNNTNAIDDSRENLLNILHSKSATDSNGDHVSNIDRETDNSHEINTQTFNSVFDSPVKLTYSELRPKCDDYHNSDSNYLLGILKKNSSSNNHNSIQGQNPLEYPFHSNQRTSNDNSNIFQQFPHDFHNNKNSPAVSDGKDDFGSQNLLNMLHKKGNTKSSSSNEDMLSYLLK